MIATGVRSASSLGVSRYCERLAAALAPAGVEYRLGERPGPAPHFHLANSSRRPLVHACGRFVVTAHDVLPRTPALLPLYRSVVFPLVRRAALVIAHSRHAADLLREAGVRRVEVVPHPATEFGPLRSDEARLALGWGAEERIALLAGVPKAAKLVEEARAAVAAPWRLHVLGMVDDVTYARAFAAADCVLVLRRESVGESNGPLLDALGAGRAVLATPTGSIPEVAGAAAVIRSPTEIASGLDEVWRRRVELERLARLRAEELTWGAAAETHAALLAEAFG